MPVVEFGTSYAFRGWVSLILRALVKGLGVRGRKVKSRDCALASDLVRAIMDTISHTYVKTLIPKSKILVEPNS